MLSRRTSLVIVIGGVGVLLAVLFALLWRDSPPRLVPIISVSATGEPNLIEVFWGCYENGEELSVVSETSEAITLSLLAAGDECRTDEGTLEFVPLRQPLGDREVIDQFDGAPVRVDGR